VTLARQLTRSPWGDLYRRDHVLVLGLPGCGKTPFATELVAGAARVVFFDMAGEWSDAGDVVAADQLAPGQLAGRFLRLVVDPPAADPVPAFLRTVELVRGAGAHGGLVLVVDEVGDLAEDTRGARELRNLHRNGHKDGVATVFCSPCWTDFPKRCRSTASRVYCFGQRDAEDVRELNAQLGRHVPGFGDLAAAWRHPRPPVAYVSPFLHS
jgi:hypothetical protein